MDKPCEICGGVGFEYCIVTCSQCCTTREHFFCMKKNLMEVPDFWICEACTSTSDVLSPTSGGEEEFLDTFGVVHHEFMHPGTPGKVCTDTGWQVNSKKLKMENGKVKFLPTEEAIRLSSGTLKLGSPGHSNTGLKCGPSSSVGPTTRGTSIPSKIITPKFSMPGVKSNPDVMSSAIMKPPTHGAEVNKILVRRAVKTSKESKEECCGKERPGTIFMPVKDDKTSKDKPEEAIMANANKAKKMYRASTTSMQSVSFKEVETSNRKIEKAVNNASPLTVSPGSRPGKTCHHVAEPENSTMEERDFVIFQSKFELYCQYRPALEATWTGGFKFFDTAQVGSFYGGFLAQPPSIVHHKVIEFSKKLPKILRVKLLPRAHLWADLFGNDCPDFHDIALYFFPSATIERSKWNNSCLFEILEFQNSVLRCCVDCVELLIFTSKQLHEDSQRVIARLDTKDFLWGVFRYVKTDHILHESHEELPSLVSTMECVCDDHAPMDNVEATDMCIDMEGGRILGPVDVVVSKELSKRACGSHGKQDVTSVADGETPHRTWKKKELEVEAKRKINIPVCWRPPPKNWVKLNIEGSSSGVMGSAGAGGTVRDESGKWLLGYTKNLGTNPSLGSELWALYLGLMLVWERGFRKVWVEFISHEVVKCLEQPTAFLDPNRALIESCRDLFHRNWDCKLQHINREANLCANWLATHCENQPLGALAVFNTPPYALIHIFHKDSAGIVQTHSH